MIEQGHRNGDSTTARVPEVRYAYYRRCQVFKRNGAQCKAPAEKGSHICHAHAGQLATAVRRERERRAMLAEAVAEMRRRGRPECEMADLFTSFKGIQVTTAVMARAVIAGRIDCKTAGQMVVQLQTVSKLLRVCHRVQEKALTTKYTKKHECLPQICADDRRLDRPGEKAHLTTEARRHGELWKSYPGPSFAVKAPLIQDDSLKRGEFAPRSFITPQICADDRRLDRRGEKAHLTTEPPRQGEQPKTLPLISTGDTDLKKPARAEAQSLTAEARRRGEQPKLENNWAANGRKEMRLALVAEVRAVAERRGWAHAPPELLRAA